MIATIASPRARDRVLFAAAVVLNVAVVCWPSAPGGVPAVPGLDKVVHVVVFAAVACTGVLAGVRPRVLLVALLVWALGSELVQALALPARGADGWDALADVAGTVVGLLAGVRLRERRRPR
jgi:VanZ family protein